MGLDWLKEEFTHSRLALTKGRQNLAISRFCRLFHTTALDESDSEFPPIYRKHEVLLVHIGRRLPFCPKGNFVGMRQLLAMGLVAHLI